MITIMSSIDSEAVPFRVPKTAELLAQRIVADVVAADLQPGDKLAPERRLLEQYGVARGTLKEALRHLEMQGAVTMVRGRDGGARVEAPDARALASTFALLLAMDRTPFRAVLDVREALEPMLASRAAEQPGDDLLAEIAGSCDAMDEHAADERRVIIENRRFHDLVALRAGSTVFGHLVGALNWIIDGVPLGVSFSPRKVRAAVRAHRAILDAIAAGDAPGAAEAMSDHLADFTRFLERRYPEVLDQPVRWQDITA